MHDETKAFFTVGELRTLLNNFEGDEGTLIVIEESDGQQYLASGKFKIEDRCLVIG